MTLFTLATFESGQYVDFEEVVCISGDGNYSYICLNDGRRLLVSKCLEHLASRLPGQQFIRIHKRYFINLRFVESIFHKQIRLTDGNVYTVARRRWPRINAYFKQKSARQPK